jgi:hypothetical protein
MRVTIIRRASGSVDRVRLAHLEVGRTYELSPPVAWYLCAIRAGVLEGERAGASSRHEDEQ